MADANSSFTNVTGLWLKESKAGNKYMSVQLTKDKHLEQLETLIADLKQHGKLFLGVYRVKNKQNENSPDYSMSYNKPDPPQQAGPAAPATQAQAAQPDDDIPF